MTTTAREFTRKFREIRAVAARGKTVRVTAPEGVYLFQREKTHKTCASALAALERYRGKGFLTEGRMALRKAWFADSSAPRTRLWYAISLQNAADAAPLFSALAAQLSFAEHASAAGIPRLIQLPAYGWSTCSTLCTGSTGV